MNLIELKRTKLYLSTTNLYIIKQVYKKINEFRIKVILKCVLKVKIEIKITIKCFKVSKVLDLKVIESKSDFESELSSIALSRQVAIKPSSNKRSLKNVFKKITNDLVLFTLNYLMLNNFVKQTIYLSSFG